MFMEAIMKKAIILFLALTLLAVFMTGCDLKSAVLNKLSGGVLDLQGDTLVIKTSDGDAAIGLGDSLSWPKKWTSDVPELKGKILSVVEATDGFSLTVEGISKTEYQNYVGKLKDKGFEETYNEEVTEQFSMFSGTKDAFFVQVQLHFEEDAKTGMCIISYNKQNSD